MLSMFSFARRKDRARDTTLEDWKDQHQKDLTYLAEMRRAQQIDRAEREIDPESPAEKIVRQEEFCQGS